MKRTTAMRDDDRWKMNHRDRANMRRKKFWFTEDSQLQSGGDEEVEP